MKKKKKNPHICQIFVNRKVFFECVIYKLEIVYLLVSTIFTLSGHCEKSVQKALLFHME